jgi:protein-disulfide isomerase
MDPVRRRLVTRCVGGDNEDFMTVVAEVLDHPKHRVGDAVDIREEGLCDDRNAHTRIVSSAAVGKVASGDTTSEVLVPNNGSQVERVLVSCTPTKAVDMRFSRAVVVFTAAVLTTAVGCTDQVSGTAKQDPVQPPLELSEDGAGIVAGYPDAPVQIEIYTEPQCDHCAELQAEFGDEIGRNINLGQLAVTYRFLTFMDDSDGEDYSARVANALFLAVGPPEAAEQPDVASGPEFQRFVQELWANQDPGGQGPTDEEMEELATKAGMPTDVADEIGSGRDATNVDIEEMADVNFASLIGLDPINSGTPTVYDLDNEEKVDIYDNGWLDKLMSSA